MAGGWWLVAGGWWLVAGGWWCVPPLCVGGGGGGGLPRQPRQPRKAMADPLGTHEKGVDEHGGRLARPLVWAFGAWVCLNFDFARSCEVVLRQMRFSLPLCDLLAGRMAASCRGKVGPSVGTRTFQGHGPPGPMAALGTFDGGSAGVRAACIKGRARLLMGCLSTSHFSLPASCFLLPASCFLLPASCFLLPASCFLLPAHCSLLTAHCSLLTAHCSLLTAHCSLLTAHCSLRLSPLLERIGTIFPASAACRGAGGRLASGVRQDFRSEAHGAGSADRVPRRRACLAA